MESVPAPLLLLINSVRPNQVGEVAAFFRELLAEYDRVLDRAVLPNSLTTEGNAEEVADLSQ